MSLSHILKRIIVTKNKDSFQFKIVFIPICKGIQINTIQCNTQMFYWRFLLLSINLDSESVESII